MEKITPILEKHYKFTAWMIPKISKFPRDQRFLLADRIENALLDVLELLIQANFSQKKRDILIKVNLKLDLLRFLMRLSRDLRYVNLACYDFFCQRTTEIGRMAGGWLKFAVL